MSERTEFEEFWYTTEYNGDFKEFVKKTWNAALDESKNKFPDLGGYEYAHSAFDLFDDNINKLKVNE